MFGLKNVHSCIEPGGRKIRLRRVPAPLFGATEKFSVDLQISRRPRRTITLNITLPVRGIGCKFTLSGLVHDPSFGDGHPFDAAAAVNLAKDFVKSRIDAVLVLQGGSWKRKDMETVVNSLIRAYGDRYPV